MDKLRILLVDDNPDDRALVKRELRKDFDCVITEVRDEKEFIRALDRLDLDVIITDYQLKWTDGLKVLSVVKNKKPDCPVIMFTGTGTEEVAVKAMKGGLDDYILKSPKHFMKLSSAVRGEINLVRERQQRKEAESALREMEQRYRIVTENMADTVCIMDMNFRNLYINPAMEKSRGFALKELSKLPLNRQVTLESEKRLRAIFAEELTPKRLADKEFLFNRIVDMEIYRKDGTTYWGEMNLTMLRDGFGVPIGFLWVGRDITDRKKSEERIRESEQRYRDLVENITDLVYVTDNAGKITFVNSATLQFFGYNFDDIYKKNFKEFLVPECYERAVIIYKRQLSGEDVGLFELDFYDKKGIIKTLETRERLIYRDGRVIEVHGIGRDITERKHAEVKIKESEQRYRELVETIDDIMYVTDSDGRVLFVNNALERVTGYTRDELINTNYMALLTPESLQNMRRLFKRQRAGEEIGFFEISFYDKDRTVKTIEVTEKPIRQGDRIVEMHGLGRDITGHKKAEERIIFLNRLLQSIRSIDQLIVWEKDRDTLLKGVCEILCEVSGYYFVWIGLTNKEDKNVVPVAYWGFEDGYLSSVKITWDESPMGKGPTGIAIRTQKTVVFTDALAHPDYLPWKEEANRRGYRSCTSSPLMIGERILGVLNVYSDKSDAFDDEEVSLLSEVAQDIAWALLSLEIEQEKFQSEMALKISEEKYRTLFETMAQGVIYQDVDNRIISANPAAERILGYSSDEFVGHTFSAADLKAVHEDGNPIDEHAFPSIVALETGKVVKDIVVGVFNRGENRVRWVKVSSVPLFRPGEDRPYQVYSSFEDITERKDMERQLVQTEKLSSLGGILSGVAHELNNPLTSIIGNAQLMMKKEIPDYIRDKLDIIAKESVRSSKIVQGLLAFAREHKPERKMVSINEVIMDSYRLREYELKVDNVSVKMSLSDKIPETAIDPYQLQQVFINLINNSHDALVTVGGGKIIIESICRNNVVIIVFTDDGPGIPQDIIKYIFDPFFTTKEVGKGTGLGLSIAYGIIKEHGGTIEAKSEPGQGSQFIITLPVVREAGRELKTDGRQIGKSKGKKKVLVVEDERSLGDLILEVLTEEGYLVDWSEDGQKAIGMIEKNRYDIIISDLKMPGISGKDLFSFIGKNHPKLASRVLFITGDVLNKETLSFLKVTGNPFIEKPFRIEVLVARLAEMLK